MHAVAVSSLLLDASVARGVKFTPPKHWVIRQALVVQYVLDEDIATILSPGDRLLAINNTPVDGMQFSSALENLRTMDNNAELRFELTRKIESPQLWRQHLGMPTKSQLIDTKAWVVDAANNTQVPYKAFILDLLQDKAIGIHAGDVLIAVNGRLVMGMQLTKVQAIIASCKPRLTMEWVDHKPHLSKKALNAWMILHDLHFQSRVNIVQCCLCRAPFNFFKKKYNCNICGQVVCSTCHAKCKNTMSTLHETLKYRVCLQCAHDVSQ